MSLAFVQRGAPNGATSGATTSAVSTAMSTTTGNLLVATVFHATASAISSVTDTAGNTYKQAIGTPSTGSNSTDIWYAYNITGNASNVTTAAYSSGSYGSVNVYEFSGFGASDPIGNSRSGLGTGTSVSSGPLTITSSQSVYFAAIIANFGGLVAGTGYTLADYAVVGDAVKYFGNEYKVVTATEAVTATSNNSTYFISAFEFRAPSATPFVQALVVGGGGSGGYSSSGNSYSGAGGGAGGYIYDSTHAVTAQAYSITVGAGGTGTTTTTASGANSVFDTLTATGGGAGGRGALSFGAGSDGGSGGGSTDNSGALTGGIGTYGQDGGFGSSAFGSSGSGGGAILAGASDFSAVGVKGGDGRANSISGASVTYAGGGGSGGYTSSNLGGAGGAGGGGAGGTGTNTTPTAGTSGTANTGGGGGGAGSSGGSAANTSGGSGGSGIVIISYHTDGSDGVFPNSTGGTITTSGAFTIHTFTASGTFTVSLSAGGIAFDAASNSGDQAAASSYSGSASWSGTNRMLAIDVSLLGAGTTVTAMTYGGAACTFIGSRSTVTSLGSVESWRICSSDAGAPGTGANTLAVTLSGTIEFSVEWVSYTGVHQSSPTEAYNSNQATNAGSATNASVVVTSIADNCWIHAAVVANDTSIAAGQTTRNNISGTLGSGANEDNNAAVTPTGTTTMTYTGMGITTTWAIGGYAIRPIAASSLARKLLLLLGLGS